MASTSVNSDVSLDLSSYEDARDLVPDLQSLDSTVQEQTGRVISVPAADAEVRSLSLDFLRQVLSCLAKANKDAANLIPQWKKDIWSNPVLLDLANCYLDTCFRNLEFGDDIEESLKRACDSLLIIQIALQKFDDESVDRERSRANTLLELEKLEDLESPFKEEFLRKFRATPEQQKLMREKLQSKKGKLDKKYKSLEAWRKVSNVLFVGMFAAVLTFSVVAAAVKAPPAVTALAAAASMLLGPMGKGVNLIWRKYEEEAKGEREIVRLMQTAIKYFDDIRVLVDKLKIEIESLLQNADSAVRGENEAVVLAADEAKKKMSVFMQTIDELGKHAKRFSSGIGRARAVNIQRIIRYPSSD